MDLGCFLEASWVPLCGPRQWVCPVSAKVFPRIVFRCEFQSASIAKTGKPYSTSSENQGWAHDGVHFLPCTQNAIIFPFKSSFCGF